MAAQPLPTTLLGTLWPAEGDTRSIGRALVLAVAGTLLLTLSAKMKVPFYPVPMTMQTLVVLVIGAVYGWRLGVATILLYLAEGASGLPVFADTPERGIGLAYMMGPTGGYLLGFVVGAAIVGWLAERGWDLGPCCHFPVRLRLARGHRRCGQGLGRRRGALLERDTAEDGARHRAGACPLESRPPQGVGLSGIGSARRAPGNLAS
jgi:hypothetical protein